MSDPRIPLKSALDLYLLESQSRRHTAHTLRFYRGRLSLFIRWCEDSGVASLSDLTHHHIRQFLIDLDQTGVSSAYLHSHARALRAFCNYCVRDDLLSISPFAKVQMPKLAKKVLPAIPPSGIDKILRACQHERDRAIVLVMLDSGVRASELCALTVGDLDFAIGSIIVQEGKGQKGRTTYIGAKSRKAVLRYFIKERNGVPPSSEPLFARQEDSGGHLEYDGLKQLMRRLRDASGVKFSAHALRRTFAINSLRNGMNVYILARLMGHADISVLRAYLEILSEDLQDAAAKFGVVDRM